MLSVNCGIHMTTWCRIVVFAILRFFSPEFKNEVKCFGVNIQYNTEMKDKVQTKKEKKNKDIKRIYKCTFFLCE